MPMPMPMKGESHDAFVSRCMGTKMMKDDFPDDKQRLAVCIAQSNKREEPMEIERRFVTTSELRVVHDGLKTKIVGHAIVFNKLSEPLMFFREQVAPEAVDRTLKENIDVRALIDHDPAKIMGRLSARTLTMKKDAHGLEVEIDPPDTTYSRDVLESIRRGDLTGMSWAFRTIKDQWDEGTEPPTRTLLDMRISEVSVVTFPAYPATDVGVAQRSLDSFREQARIVEPQYPSLAMRRRMLEIDRA